MCLVLAEATRPGRVAVAALLLALPSRAVAADVPEAARAAGYGADDWQKLTKGKVIARMDASRGNPPVSEGRGAFIIAVPWRHAFDQIGRIEEMPKYSSCLKAMEIRKSPIAARFAGGSIRRRRTRMLPGFLKGVREEVEKGHARGAHR